MTDKLLDPLNPEQKKAVTYTGGPLLVLAGAGSGKTRVLTHRAAWLMREEHLSPDSVLLLTFTNKAAAEMKERILRLVNTAPTLSGTFHSFCVRVLRISGSVINIPRDFIIYDSADQKDVVKEIVFELNLPPESYKPASVLAIIGDAKNQLMNASAYGQLIQSDKQEKIFSIYQEYEKALTRAGALDFDDLLLKAVEVFQKSSEALNYWRQKVSYVLVDEWQDTNKIQYQLTKLLVGDRGNLTAVGDASQSIYSWRGADYKNINYLMQDFPEIHVINLEQNYRSTDTILSAANSVISKNTSHPILKLWTENGKGERIKIYKAQNGLDEASFVINKIRELTRTGYNCQDIAVLYRTNAQSRVLEEALLHTGVPYTLVGGVRFYDRAEVKDVISLLRLLINRNDTVSLRRLEKIGKKRKENFETFRDSINNVSQETTLNLMDAVIAKVDYLAKFARQSEENLARIENLKELRSVASEFPNLPEFLENVALVEA